MRNLNIKIFVIVFLCAITQVFATQKPIIKPFLFGVSANIIAVSDNGLWAVASGNNSENTTISDYPFIINTTTSETQYLLTDDEMESGITAAVYDITDDGKTACGTYNGDPAIYQDGKWKKLPVTGRTITAGAAYSMTPDGRFIVGRSEPISDKGNFKEYYFFWADGVFTELEGLPTKDIQGNEILMHRMDYISADGNVISGCLNYSYLTDGTCTYVYYRDTKTYEIIGQNVLKRYEIIHNHTMSTSGELISGTMECYGEYDGEEVDGARPFIYNTKTKEFKPYASEDNADIGVFAITNDGIMIGCSPFVNPVRTVKIRVGNFWYNLDEMLSQKYDVDFFTETGFEYTGVVGTVSADGKVIGGMAVANYENFIVKIPDTFTEIAKGVNLLSTYSISPAAGSSFNKVSTFAVTFERDAIVLDGAKDKIKLYDGDTVIATAISVKKSSQSSRSFQIGFVPKTLEEGKRYTLKIEAGCFGIEGSEMSNKEIQVAYIGRENRPVSPLQYSMEDGSEQSELSYIQNLTIKFDIPITPVEGKTGYLYQNDADEPLCSLNIVNSENYLAVYPLNTQHFYLGNTYKVVIPAGTVTDSQGACGNDEIVLNYIGIYKREIPTPGTTLFDEDFNDPANSYNSFMLYDGDKLTPTEAMQAFSFDRLNTPWNFSIRESSSSTDYCAAATSSYNPAGTSEDWMSTVQLQIPSDKYILSWKSQSYKSDKQDILRVYVWECDDEINNLSEEVVKRIEAEGDKVYESVENPGVDEENLTGDWKENVVSLDKYKNKKVYIAFLNRNTDQSIIFVDDVKVDYNGTFAISNSTPSITKMKSEVEVSGFVEIIDSKENAEYNAVTVTLKDGNNDVIDTKVANNLSLKKGDRYEYSFDKKLPLELGKITSYSVLVNVNGDENTVNATVKNLSFEPVKRIVLEEGTGAWCGNCPLGILAIDNLQKNYPNNIIPIAIHSNSGGRDPYDFSDYCSALGINAFPTGFVNRYSTLLSPAVQENDVYSFISTSQDETFTDIFLKELEEGAEFDVNITKATYDTQLNKLSINANVKPAVDLTNANYRVFFVILENGLNGAQSNYFYVNADPLFGDWGKNGIYNKSGVEYTYNHVARAVLGNSIVGTAGLIPTKMNANAEYPFEMDVNIPSSVKNWNNASIVCALIDANTDKIINANELGFTNAAGVNGTFGEQSITTTVIEDKVIANFAENANAVLSLYNTNGVLVSQVESNVESGESLTVSSNGVAGVFIVNVRTDKQSITKKAILK